jgi:hypothetical protein
VIVVVEPAVAVEAAIHTENVEATFHEPRPETAPIYPSTPVTNTRIPFIRASCKTETVG